MIYKVYVEGSRGYESKGKYSEDALFFLLDELILNNEVTSTILVIQHDISQNMDSPFYLFTGSKLEYLTFKEVFSKPDKQLMLT